MLILFSVGLYGFDKKFIFLSTNTAQTAIFIWLFAYISINDHEIRV